MSLFFNKYLFNNRIFGNILQVRIFAFFALFILLVFFNSCEFKIKEQEYDNGPGKPQEEAASEPSNPDLSKDFLIGKFDYKKDERFVLVDKKWSKNEVYLQKKTYDAFLKMAEEAKKDDIQLVIISGTQSFEDQKKKWDNKWKANQKKNKNQKELAGKILQNTYVPGTSRHHWGTEIDLNSTDESYFTKEGGKKVYRWLVENAAKFGFCQVYTDKKGSKRKGYKTESGHWSYMPLSNFYLDNYSKTVSLKDIKGFSGSEFIKDFSVIPTYIQGIDRSCSSIGNQPEQ